MITYKRKGMMQHGEVAHSIKGRVRLCYDGLKYLKSSAPSIQDEIEDVYYIKSARINTVTQSVLIYYDAAETSLRALVEDIDSIMSGHSVTAYKASRLESESSQVRTDSNLGSSRTIFKRLLLNGAVMILDNTIFKNNPLFDYNGPSMVKRMLTVPSVAGMLLTAPLFKTAAAGIVTDHRPNADFLTVSSIIASILLGNGTSALTIIALSDIAELMTTYTIEKTRSSIKDMLSVDDGHAWKVCEDGSVKKTVLSEIKAGDKIVVHTGEKIAVDGTVTYGEAVIDQSSVTGEFIPADKKVADKVFAGGIVKSGAITVIADKVGDDTVVSRIINMVENVADKKAPIQNYADQFSNYLVPLNFMAAAAVYLVTKSADKALKMLVIDYSCGIKLSTAAAFSASINTAVKNGVLIKGGAFIEQMSKADTIVFDKTGTLTEGKPDVVGVTVCNSAYDEERIVALALAAEETSSHPMAAAIMAYGRRTGVKVPKHTDDQTIISKGIQTKVGDVLVRVGSKPFMEETGVEINVTTSMYAGSAAIYIAADDVLAGIVHIADKPRENIKRAINNLRYKGIGEMTLMTGDTESQARAVAQSIGVDSYKAQLMPEDKAEAVLFMQSEGANVVMVGDGINDALALAYANVGISLGSKSTDVAMETSDIIIAGDDPMLIPSVIEMSETTMDVVRQNFSIVIAINTIGLIIGAASNLSVFWSAMLHNMSTILVVANSCRLMFQGRLTR